MRDHAHRLEDAAAGQDGHLAEAAVVEPADGQPGQLIAETVVRPAQQRGPDTESGPVADEAQYRVDRDRGPERGQRGPRVLRVVVDGLLAEAAPRGVH